MAPISDSKIVQGLKTNIPKIPHNDIPDGMALTAKLLSDFCNGERSSEYSEEFVNIKFYVDMLKMSFFKTPKVKIQFTYLDDALHLVFVDEKVYEEFGSYYDYYCYSKILSVEKNDHPELILPLSDVINLLSFPL